MIKTFYLMGIIVSILACSPVMLTRDITHAQAYKLYRNARQQTNEYFLTYNTDSTYVICTVNDSSQLVMQPITFLVVNLHDREKTFVSIGEYHKAQWLDDKNIRLVKYMGIANFDRSFDRKATKNWIEFNLNVVSGKLIQVEDTENELF